MKPTDNCGRCGCERRYHNPPEWEPRTKGRYRPNLARTCCSSCPHCLCFCFAWTEPYLGQPFGKCAYKDFLPPRRAVGASLDVEATPSTRKTVLAGPPKKRAGKVESYTGGSLFPPSTATGSQ